MRVGPDRRGESAAPPRMEGGLERAGEGAVPSVPEAPVEPGTARRGDRASSADPPRSAYARLDSPKDVVGGVPFTVCVGLSEKQSPDVQGGRIVRPPSSVGPYTLTVQLMIDGFTPSDPSACRQELRVTAEAPYPSVELALTAVAPEAAEDARSIMATFSVEGQIIGVASRAVVVHADESTLPAAAVVSETTGVDMPIPTQETAADLTITIARGSTGSKGCLQWTLETPWSGIDLPREALKSDIGSAPDQFARALVDKVNLREGQPDLGPFLEGVGATIAEQVPARVLEVLREVAARVDASDGGEPTVLLISEEPYVPWELACIDPPLYADRPPFLATQVVVGRWVLGQSRPKLPPPMAVDAENVAVVWGAYQAVPGWQRLVNAEEEGKELTRVYAARHVDAKMQPVLDCLDGTPPAEVLHFSMHGIYDPNGLQDGLVLTDRSPLEPFTVRGKKLEAAPFVFLNACQVGSGQAILGDYAGLADAFLFAGAAAVIAPLWSIKDDEARDIALRFYERAFAGETPARILREERAQFGSGSHPHSGTCLAYQFFGHPKMHLRRRSSAPAAAEEDTP